jgi:UDP-3-O-[3-hydroxymyristoyl] glucosamine N-acyltransferase
MDLKQPETLESISEIINCKFSGEPKHQITGFNEIHKVRNGDVVFVDHPKYYDKALESAATTIIINKEVTCPKGKGLIFSEDPCADFNKLTRHFKPSETFNAEISPSSVIHPSSIIEPGVIIGNHVRIGKQCLIRPGVVVHDYTEIGDHVIIHANTVLGADAFYYKKRGSIYDKMHTCGKVVIEDDVEIGALCTIDKGVTGDTHIKKGTKIDNQVQIGHDTVIGENCLIAAHSGIAGATILKDNVTLWGQVGITSGVTIGEGAVISAKSGVSKSLPGGVTYVGAPAVPLRNKYREMAALRKLPELINNLEKYESKQTS